jgi:spore germination protein YaaH
VARPSKYKTEYKQQAAKLAKLGAIDTQIADFFNVSVATINNWKTQHPEFLESLKGGKADADNMVKQALFTRAIGYNHPEVHISNYQGVITKTKIVKQYPPDSTSCIFWLKNRDPDNWREKPDGITDDDAPPLKYTFNVRQAAAEIKVTNAKP